MPLDWGVFMNQDQQLQCWWKDTSPVLALVALIVVIAPMTVAQEPDEAWQRDLDIAGS
jgi:hypothetical protein